MGSNGSTLTSWEAKAPLDRVTELRLRVIRTLTVSSAEIGRMLALKAASMPALELVIFNVDLDPFLQEQIADKLANARGIKIIEFNGMSPLSTLVNSALSIPFLYSLRFINVMLTEAVPILLSKQLKHVPTLRSLHFDNVTMPPGTFGLVLAAANPRTCSLSTVNMSSAMFST